MSEKQAHIKTRLGWEFVEMKSPVFGVGPKHRVAIKRQYNRMVRHYHKLEEKLLSRANGPFGPPMTGDEMMDDLRQQFR